MASAGPCRSHDRTTGAVVARWTNDVWPNPTNISDIAIAPNGDAYIIDAEHPVLYRIPAAELREPECRHDRTCQSSSNGRTRRTPTMWPGFLEANGIVVTPDGKYLLVVHYSDGFLFRVRLSDKQVRQVDLGGNSLFSGDGMVLTDDNVLYVVRPVRLTRRQAARSTRSTDRGRLLSETTDPTFHGPTAAAIAGDRLLVVNSQFSGPPPAPPWTVSSIALPEHTGAADERRSAAAETLPCDHLGARPVRASTATPRRSDHVTGSCWRCWPCDPARW